MTSVVFLAILCIGIMAGASAHDPSLDAEWEEWKIDYEKSYTPVGGRSNEENSMGKKLKIIKDHNGENGLGKNGYTMEMNGFGDMTDEEFKDMMVNIPVQPHNKEKSIWKRAVVGGGLPKFVDWRKKGYMTPVQNQGKCGSCWAFTVAGAIKGQMFHKTGKVTPLSVQNLVDCSKSYGNNGCASGNTYNAFQYVLHNGGIEAEATYPYERKEWKCRYRPGRSAAKIKAFFVLPESEDILMDAVANNGPVAVSIDAFHDSFLFYKTGIYHEPNCSSSVVKHAVLVVGYGYEGDEMDGNNYWLIKNSWGKKWGLRGYMKFAKDRNNHCQIASYAQYPIV